MTAYTNASVNGDVNGDNWLVSPIRKRHHRAPLLTATANLVALRRVRRVHVRVADARTGRSRRLRAAGGHGWALGAKADPRLPACLPAWASPNHDHWCESSREERDHNASLAFLGLGEPHQGRPWLTTPPPRPLDWRDDYSCVHTDAMLPSRPAETSFMPAREATSARHSLAATFKGRRC